MASGHRSDNHADGPASGVRVLEGALPRGLCSRLQDLLSLGAPFWAHHNYGAASTDFLSYFVDLGPGDVPGAGS